LVGRVAVISGYGPSKDEDIGGWSQSLGERRNVAGSELPPCLDTPGSPVKIVENTGKHRATCGVAKAKLQYKGVFDATAGIVDNDYWGVVRL
jgi:hypothetical protein